MKIASYDIFDDKITEFRKEVILENGGDLKYLDTDIKYDPNINEEVWKFSLRKWNSLGLDKLYGAELNDKIYAIAGAKKYGDYVRFGMMYYRLRKSPKEIFSPLWVDDGFLDLTLNDLINDKTKAYFVTIYPHNRKLEKWVQAFKEKRYRQGKYTEKMNLEVIETPISFNHCQQYVMYKPLNNFLLEEFISELED